MTMTVVRENGYLATTLLLAMLGLVAACSTTRKQTDAGANGAETPAAAAPRAEPPGDETEATTGVPCGPSRCTGDEICCNESCGICTPPGGFCTQQFCESEADAKDEGGVCSADRDCRAFSDYCTGCDCRALAEGDPDPTCAGPGVRCLMDPCQGKRAACVDGRCAVRAR